MTDIMGRCKELLSSGTWKEPTNGPTIVQVIPVQRVPPIKAQTGKERISFSSD